MNSGERTILVNEALLRQIVDDAPEDAEPSTLATFLWAQYVRTISALVVQDGMLTEDDSWKIAREVADATSYMMVYFAEKQWGKHKEEVISEMKREIFKRQAESN